MAAMRAVGAGHILPPHASVREDPSEYLIQLDVSDFTENELTVERVGPRLTVRGDQQETAEDKGEAFRLHERLEESFRLPDDADADRTKAVYTHGTLEIHVRRKPLTLRVVPIERQYLVNPIAKGC